MGFLDELSRKLSEGVDRARFEAEKFQRVTAIQGEIGNLRRQVDAKRLEFGDRAIELLKAGAIQSPTLAALLREIEALQASLTLKEEELRHVQGQAFIEPSPAPRAQHVPVTSSRRARRRLNRRRCRRSQEAKSALRAVFRCRRPLFSARTAVCGWDERILYQCDIVCVSLSGNQRITIVSCAFHGSSRSSSSSAWG